MSSWCLDSYCREKYLLSIQVTLFGPTTRSPARLASPFPFLSLRLFLRGKDFSAFRIHVQVATVASHTREILNFQAHFELDVPRLCYIAADYSPRLEHLHFFTCKGLQKEDDCVVIVYYCWGQRMKRENSHVRGARVRAPHFQHCIFAPLPQLRDKFDCITAHNYDAVITRRRPQLSHRIAARYSSRLTGIFPE